MNKHSSEEQAEDWVKSQFNSNNIHFYRKTDSINPIIEQALSKAPSKTGGKGHNYPDTKLLLINPKNIARQLPVMIEVKGAKGKLIKLNKNGFPANETSNNEPNYNNINAYAVNGAVHYAQAIVDYSNDIYKECLAIGVNGYKENNEMVYEIEAWYIDKDNFSLPKKIGNYHDLSFLFPSYEEQLFITLDQCVLTEDEVEHQKTLLENEFDGKLREYNQYLHDELKISTNHRVALTAGLLMAGFGIKNTLSPLKSEDFRGEQVEQVHDGYIAFNKIRAFLTEKELPEKERDIVLSYLKQTFIQTSYYKTLYNNGRSKIALAYDKLASILPSLLSDHSIDYMGKLFNVLNDWVDVPDGEENDVVLTPRYICTFMARLAQVDMDSYVWDWASGTGGFLISSMNLMIKDAENRIASPTELKRKIDKIRMEQLLGVEIREDIYLLHLLNMLLLDGSFTNVLKADSLNPDEFNGDYPYSSVPTPFNANVFLLNPPYSAAGKGLVFVEKAFNKMRGGYGVVITQENAGDGQDAGYGKKILKNNTLLASIRMPRKLFYGKSEVQTAIYVFQIGIPHDKNKIVKFIDMSNDGYERTARRKNKKVSNLHNKDHALERYEEVIAIVLGKKVDTDYYKTEHYIEDTISLNGNDWTYKQHQNLNKYMTEEDFLETVGNYLEWKTTNV